MSKHYRTNPVGDYSKKLQKQHQKNAIFKTKKKRKKNGCYVATCVYGTYDCPELWVLRRYRDDYLDRTIMGSLFISFYYFFSPFAIKLFGNTRLFKNIFRPLLNNIVKNLRDKGYSDKPYKDEY